METEWTRVRQWIVPRSPPLSDCYLFSADVTAAAAAAAEGTADGIQRCADDDGIGRGTRRECTALPAAESFHRRHARLPAAKNERSRGLDNFTAPSC